MPPGHVAVAMSVEVHFSFFFSSSFCPLFLFTGEEGERGRQVLGSFQAPGGKALDSCLLTAGLSLASF